MICRSVSMLVESIGSMCWRVKPPFGLLFVALCRLALELPIDVLIVCG